MSDIKNKMLDFKEKQKTRRLMYSSPMLVFLAILFVFFASRIWGLYQTNREAVRKANEAKAELRSLEERKTDLEKRVSFLKTERGQESEIREKFMVGKEGEGVILVVDTPQATTTKESAPEPSAWSRFLNFFR
ncbi:MAG: hypothetical protein NTZ13_00475 [Candidatus Parcubacteria bacterium]|nr:hypothetical protein [Candidatus Parcubacteria bacterium]